MNLNKVQIIGRITQPLELKTLPNGTSVLNFSVATNYVYKDQAGNKVENTEFHNVVSFGKQAQTVAQYFVKGQEIYVEGRLQTRSWDDKDSGKKMYRTEILLNNFEFGAKPMGQGGNAAGNNSYNQDQQQNQNFNQDNAADTSDQINYPEEEINPEDIPF
ncbi:single-stranded DNA-binding protein [Candidatus Campbellbacteria bacterium]|nr:MAG: single-stranded DNA-binding protein [Candidatus Campbellbacteria bacterium]